MSNTSERICDSSSTIYEISDESDSDESVVILSSHPKSTDIIKIEDDASQPNEVKVEHDSKSSIKMESCIPCDESDGSVVEVPGSPESISNLASTSNKTYSDEIPQDDVDIKVSISPTFEDCGDREDDEAGPMLDEDAGLGCNYYASDENAIYVSTEIYDRERANFDALVEETLGAEKERVKLENESKSSKELLEAKQKELKLNDRLKLMSQYIDSLRTEDDKVLVKPEPGIKAEEDEQPSWAHLYAGANQYRHKAEGSVAEFYQHKSNIISGLKTLYHPDGPPPSAEEFAEQPKALLVSLLKHQKVGLKWLLWRERQKIRGGILADDMGLGKTLSMVAVILASNEQKQTEHPIAKSTFDYKKSWEQQLKLYNNHKSQLKRIRVFDDSDNEEEEEEKQLVLPPKREYKPPVEDEDDNEFLDENNNTAGTLIICPMSVMSQWAAEATTKVNSNALKVHIYHGNKRRDIGCSSLRRMDLVITSYSTAVSEWTRWASSSWLFSLEWERLILDEAHIIRNTKTSCCQTVSAIKARNRWALTGTPIQNRALDCFALLKFLRVPNFKDLQQWRRYLNEGIAGHRRMSFLVKPLMLRRTKLQLQASGDMPALPPLEVKLIDVQLSPPEMTVYKIISAISLKIFAQFLRQREQNNRDLNYYANERTPSFIIDEIDNKYHEMYDNFLRSIGYNPRERVKGIVILVLLLRLRQFCCHPGLMVKMLCGEMEESDSEEDEDSLENSPHGKLIGNVLNNSWEDDKSGIKNEDTEEKFSVKQEQNYIKKEEYPSTSKYLVSDDDTIDMETAMKLLRPSNPIFEFERPSSKLKLIFATLEKILEETNDKIIVVSQWTSFLFVIKEHLDSIGHEVLQFNGKMDAMERSETLSEFNVHSSDKRILLLSLTAGGVGLNLNVANHLLMVDLHWNPQLERQAQDRIYRYGQQKPSYIYRFMCRDTVEQRIKALQDYKIEIANVVLNPDAVNPAPRGNALTLKDLKKIFGM